MQAIFFHFFMNFSALAGKPDLVVTAAFIGNCIYFKRGNDGKPKNCYGRHLEGNILHTSYRYMKNMKLKI